MLDTGPGVHLALATDRDEDVPTHVLVKVAHGDGASMKWPMTAAETRRFAAALLDYADAIDEALEE